VVEVRKTEFFQRWIEGAGGTASEVTVKKTTKTTKYDVAEHLRTTKEMSAYLEASLAEADGDPALIAKALGDIARARGMTEIARHSGLSRESLYKALSGDRVPDFGTILRVVKALGLELHVSPAR
jgi:probable addiction module antidote protein